MQHFIVRVERAPEGGEVRQGEIFELASEQVSVGRSPSAQLSLSDPSISSHHLTLEFGEHHFTIRNVSKRGSTWVDRRALEPGEEVEVEEVAWIQPGRVLLHVSIAESTMPVETLYSLPLQPASDVVSEAEVFLEVDVGLHPTVRIRGREQSLFPMALRVLWRLGESAGEVVSHDDLQDAISPTASAGGMNLPQNITYLRDMFEEAIGYGELSEDELREELAECLGPARVQDMGQRELLRALVQSVRGQGYRLNLTPEQVCTRD